MKAKAVLSYFMKDLTSKLSDEDIAAFLNQSDDESVGEEERALQNAFNILCNDNESEESDEELEETAPPDEQRVDNDIEEVVLQTEVSAIDRRVEQRWLHKNMPEVQVVQESLNEGVEVLEKSILEAFLQYLDISFWNDTAFQTNLYSCQQNNLQNINTSEVELLHLTGIHVIMSCLKYPQLKMYWSKNLGLKLISNCMTRNRFSF